jgi:hypothetical protein
MKQEHKNGFYEVAAGAFLQSGTLQVHGIYTVAKAAARVADPQGPACILPPTTTSFHLSR